MSGNTRISVIVPARNASQFVREAIASVQIQTLEDWELIFIDDGSTDGTADIVKELASRDTRIRLFSQPNAGVSVSRNRGLEFSASQAPLAIFPDADDVLMPEAFAMLVDALKENRDASAAHGVPCYIDEAGNPMIDPVLEQHWREREYIEDGRIAKAPAILPTNFGMLAITNCICTPGCGIVRKECINWSPPFNPDLSPCADWEFWLKLSRNGDIAFVPEVVIGYRRHGSNMSGNRRKMRDEMLKLRRGLTIAPWLEPDKRGIAAAAFRQTERRGLIGNLRLTWAYLAKGQIGASIMHFRRACGYARHV